ncbi:MAG: zinc ribbon domain-containing protein [Planctomycetes bacterium]|nr:zinc ribbon domain-containing protein [Planctomycetota bacterium]
MPLYEYMCPSCEKPFEALVAGDRSGVKCPVCGSGRVVKQFSAFAVGAAVGPSATPAPPAGPCGRCGDPNPCPYTRN